MKTQKAQGLECHIDEFPKIDYVVVQNADEIDGVCIPNYFGDTLFVRPCPVRPRHGFLESFPVRRDGVREALREVFAKMTAIGEDGEIVIMPFVKARYNAIIAPGSVTIGRGNAGATSGVDAITLPFPKINVEGWDPQWGEPYIELVKGINWHATQFRGGPPVENTDDFIVDGFRVEHVYELHSDIDLLEWEKIVRRFPRGTVVFHRGGAVTSHYGVHCVVAGVPYFTSRIPEVGEVLTSKVAQKKRYRNLLKRFRHHVKTIQISYKHIFEVVRASIFVMHYYPKMTPQQRELLVPLFAAVWCRVGEALCLGEARHAKASHKDGCSVISFAGHGYSRDNVYTQSLSGAALGVSLEDVHKCFSECYWESQYGGKAWARCARSILKMLNAKTVAGLMAAWNRSVNLAHNTGWWMNKVISKHEFDTIGRPKTALFAAETIYEIFYPTEDYMVEFESFDVQWRQLHERKIRVQCQELGIERDIHVYADLESIVFDSAFTLKSTAGTDKMYAPAKIVVRNGDVSIEFILADGGTAVAKLGTIRGSFATRADLLSAILQNDYRDKEDFIIRFK